MVLVVLYCSSCPSTLKVRSDTERIRHMLDAKGVAYKEVCRSAGFRGAMRPCRRPSVTCLTHVSIAYDDSCVRWTWLCNQTTAR